MVDEDTRQVGFDFVRDYPQIPTPKPYLLEMNSNPAIWFDSSDVLKEMVPELIAGTVDLVLAAQKPDCSSGDCVGGPPTQSPEEQSGGVDSASKKDPQEQDKDSASKKDPQDKDSASKKDPQDKDSGSNDFQATRSSRKVLEEAFGEAGSRKFELLVDEVEGFVYRGE